MNENWGALSKQLYSIYFDLDLMDHVDNDMIYLWNAYQFTESLWFQQFVKLESMKCVILSEAPLYGSKKTYIYNIESKPTSFFHFNDLKAIIDDNEVLPKKFKSPVAKKAYMIDIITKYGVLILDIFPFAFNSHDTKINYGSIGDPVYNRLLKESIPYFLGPKLEKIRQIKGNPVFVYRYARLLKTSSYIENELKKCGLLRVNDKLNTINGTNMSLDRSYLKEIYHHRNTGV